MGKLINRLLAFAAIAPFAVSGAATASTNSVLSADEQAWAQTVEQNTLEAYASFAMEYPESGFASEARSRLITASLSDEGISIYSGANRAGRASVPDFIPGSMMVV